MILAVYARKLDIGEIETFNTLRRLAREKNISLVYHKGIEQLIQKDDNIDKGIFNTPKQLAAFKPSAFLSIGGDGTLLDSVLYVKESNVPVLGINTGRLGFLSNTSPNELEKSLELIIGQDYEIEKRSILSCTVEGPNKLTTYALNDISVHKRDTSAMITIHCYLNGEPFNTYWSDGLLVSSPTGSTAYSLSCGGPILFPNAKSFLITPVAPHNLNIRPIIVSDDTKIKMVVEGRGANFLMAFDSRNRAFDYKSVIEIEKAPFELNLVKFKNKSFVSTLQEKLNWGKDNRNLGEQSAFI
ncbi:MAG: NAD kinase [Bacteroidia bacterium]